MDRIPIDIGTDARFKMTLKQEDQSPSAAFTLSDTPTASVWSGRNLASVFSPTATWIDPAEPSLLISFSASDTQGLDPGRYYLRTVIITSAGLKIAAPDAEVILSGSPGVAAPPKTDVTYADLTRYAPWLESQASAENEAGFLDERGAARDYVLRIFSMWYRSIWTRRRSHEGWFGSMPLPDVMETFLNDGSSLVIDDRIKEIESRYAIGLITENSLSADPKNNAYQEVGARNKRQAQRLLDGLVVHVVNAGASVDLRWDQDRLYSRNGWGVWI